ncbi:MAG: hypothetical protein QW693_05080, partial [Candidatus Bathyarchaeia archaeon]
LGKAIRLTQEELNNIFNFKKAILERRSTGSSSPKEVEKEILNMQRKINEYKIQLTTRINKVNEALEELQRIVNSYIEE